MKISAKLTLGFALIACFPVLVCLAGVTTPNKIGEA